jgi:hypothetical protein
MSQVRETRQQYWDDNHEEQKAFYNEARAALAELDMADPGYEEAVQHCDEAAAEWHEWFEENYPGSPKDRAKERTRLKRKSKRTARERIVVTDDDVFQETKDEQYVKVEWGDWLADGCLVQTKTGEIGIVVATQDAQGYKNADYAVTHGGMVQLMLNGDLTWRKKITLRPLDD